MSALPGVGPRVADSLALRGVRTVEDLLRFLPRRYQGRDSCQELASLRPMAVAAVEAQVVNVSMGPSRGRGRRNLEVELSDGTGSLFLVWFRSLGPAFAEQFVRGSHVRAAGMVRRFRHRLQIAHPEFARVEAAGAADAGQEPVVPLYLDVHGLTPRQLRAFVRRALASAPQLQDPLPEALRARHALPPLAGALQAIHAPAAEADLEALQAFSTAAQRRLIYEELLVLQLALLAGDGGPERDAAVPLLPLAPQLGAAGDWADALAGELLPFVPTPGQRRALAAIAADLDGRRPMQRLLQGDVGSGKTAVAQVAAARVVLGGYQAAIMAPTELLAEQHLRSARRVFAPRGIEVALVTGSLGARQRREVHRAVAAGEVQVVVGTHALLHEEAVPPRLGLAVIDEQHRFGVMQRARLRQMGRERLGRPPHLLVMTATPIPRTLAMTVYGDLDLCVIDGLPPGRRPIATELFFESQRQLVYQQVRAAVAAGRQAYVVFPLVEESDKEGMERIRDATSSFEELAAGPLHALRLGLLHGRMTAAEKDGVMRAFAGHQLDVLIATTVVEVGIDVANATVMVIEHAERFGLSQLHQLRGRVGRGAHASACLLVARGRRSPESLRRLQLMTHSSDGFRIAEADLEIRGPGDFMGTRQAGLPLLTVADLSRDRGLLMQAREDAQALLAADAALAGPDHRLLAARVAAHLEARQALAHTG